MRLATKRVIVVGLFSARVRDPEAELDTLALRVEGQGGTVVGRLLQRRGVSRDLRPGGARRMAQPLSSATVLGRGKVAELAELCRSSGADAVVFHNPLSDRQKLNLEAACGVPVHDLQ